MLITLPISVNRSQGSLPFLRIRSAPIIQLGRVRVTAPGGLLAIFKLRAIFVRRGDERCPHRMRRVATAELKVIYISGFDIPHAAGEALGPIIRKRVDGDQLLDAIARTLTS